MKSFFKSFVDPADEFRPKVRYWVPEAFTQKEFLEKDLEDLKKRGFSGIELVPMAVEKEARLQNPGSSWGSKKWFENVEIILRKAKSLNMTVDFSISLQWPISMPNIETCDDASTLYELTYGVSEVKDNEKSIELPKRRKNREEGTSKLVGVMAYEHLGDKVIKKSSYIDLYSFVHNDKIEYDFPTTENEWLVFSFWEQPTCQKVNGLYVIDHLSKSGVKKCSDFWLENMEPIIRKYPDQCHSIFCDSLEYDVSQDWTRDFAQVFKETKKYDLIPYLPILSTTKNFPKTDSPDFIFEDQNETAQINHDYCDILTKLYNENHLIPLESLAHRLGMSLRYQVAYNKSFDLEYSAKNVDIPENEALFRPTLDNLKSMAGVCHIYQKKIYSYECCAEFDNGYGQTYADIFWWIKRGLVSGMNHQVFHGAAYNGPVHFSNWPGYEPFGKKVSNYWNRSLSIKNSYKNLTYIARLNRIMQLNSKVDLLILKNSFVNDGKGDDGQHILKDDGLLISHGFSYDIISTSALQSIDLVIEKGRLFPTGPAYKALVVPKEESFSESTLKLLIKLATNGFPIFIQDGSQFVPFFYQEKSERILDYSKELFKEKMVVRFTNFSKLIKKFAETDVFPDVTYLKNTEVVSVHKQSDVGNFYVFYNYNKVKLNRNDFLKKSFDVNTIKPSINRNLEENKRFSFAVKESQKPILLDPVNGKIEPLYFKEKDGKTLIELDIAPDQILIVGFLDSPYKSEMEKPKLLNSDAKKLESFNRSMFSFVPKANDSDSFYDSTWKKLNTFADQENHSCDKISYEYRFDLFEKGKLYLKFTGSFDSCLVCINGQEIVPLSSNIICVDLSKGIKIGENSLRIEIFNTLFNKFNYKNQKKFGINNDIYILKCK